MAHDAETKRKVQNAYIYDCLELSNAAVIVGVPFPNAQRWKADARKSGDD